MKAQSVSIVKVTKALDTLAETPAGASLEELAAELDLSRPAALRLFESMVETGIAIRTDSKRYRLSLRAYEWGNKALALYAPSFATRREMSRLATAVQHRVWYAVLENVFATTLDRTEFIENETVSFPVANRSPWWLTASGLVIAAFSSEPKRNELFKAVASEASLESFEPTPRQRELMQSVNANAVTDPSELATKLEGIRQSGIARLDYVELGIALAAPILDASGSAAAALGVTVLSGEDYDLEPIERQLRDSAARCSNHLGYSRTFMVS